MRKCVTLCLLALASATACDGSQEASKVASVGCGLADGEALIQGKTTALTHVAIGVGGPPTSVVNKTEVRSISGSEDIHTEIDLDLRRVRYQKFGSTYHIEEKTDSRAKVSNVTSWDFQLEDSTVIVGKTSHFVYHAEALEIGERSHSGDITDEFHFGSCRIGFEHCYDTKRKDACDFSVLLKDIGVPEYLIAE